MATRRIESRTVLLCGAGSPSTEAARTSSDKFESTLVLLPLAARSLTSSRRRRPSPSPTDWPLNKTKNKKIDCPPSPSSVRAIFVIASSDAQTASARSVYQQPTCFQSPGVHWDSLPGSDFSCPPLRTKHVTTAEQSRKRFATVNKSNGVMVDPSTARWRQQQQQQTPV